MSISTAILRQLLIICLMSVFLISCGGESKSDYEIDVELCEAQDGNAQILSVYNVDTGESYIQVNCEFPKDNDIKYCKVDGGFGGEC